MNRKIVPILLFIFTLPALGKDSLSVNIPPYDTLLINHKYEELIGEIERNSEDSVTAKKYLNLIREFQYIPNYSIPELIELSEMGLKYETIFTQYQSGEVASNYYKIYRKYHAEQNYVLSAQTLKIAHSHRASYLLILSNYVMQHMDEANTYLKSGNYSQAYDTLCLLEKDIYNIEKLQEFRELFDMRFTRCKFIGDERAKTDFLSESKYNPLMKYEISLQGGLLLWGKSYRAEKYLYYEYKNAPNTCTPHSITGFEASEGYYFGFDVSRRILPQTQFLFSYGITRTTYIAHNDVSGWDTDFSSRDTELGVGLRYYVQAEGRLRWWTSVQFKSIKMSPIEKSENYSVQSEMNLYYISFENMTDTQLDLDIGFSLFLKTNWPISVQPH